MEWKKIASMENGKIVFHSIPCPDSHTTSGAKRSLSKFNNNEIYILQSEGTLQIQRLEQIIPVSDKAKKKTYRQANINYFTLNKCMKQLIFSTD